MGYNEHTKGLKMPKVVIKRDGFEIEADLTLEEIKNLAGLGSSGRKAEPPAEPPRAASAVTPIRGKLTPKTTPDFSSFLKDISDRAQKFLRIMRENPEGIDARDLAPLLDFKNPAQIGGLTGPGLSKVARRHGIKIADVYRSEIIFPGGMRKRMFYPGKLTLAMTDETPLFARG